MKNLEFLDCFQPGQVMLERVNYFPRQLLTVEDMVTERDYFLQKLRRHNRFMHGWGVVCGLSVTAAPTDTLPWQVRISSGYALGPYGDEIYVAESFLLDLSKCKSGTTTNPCEPDILSAAPGASIGTQVFIAIKYAECLARPVQAMPAGCACEDDSCEYSRIRDSFQIECLSELPPMPPKSQSMCDIIARAYPAPCPPCPSTPWVVLAQVFLPSTPSTLITDNNIDNMKLRRQIFSTAILQQQLIDCCCHDTPPPRIPVRVTSVNFVEGKRYYSVGGEAPPEKLRFVFDKKIDPATANEKSIRVNWVNPQGTGLGQVLVKEIKYYEAQLAVEYVPIAPFTFPPPGLPPDATSADFTVIVSGTGTDKIIDIDGLALDGKKTGNPGSDFVGHFSVNFARNPVRK